MRDMPHKDPAVRRTYVSFSAMWHRCVLSPHYHPYYAGVIICDQWRSFDCFLRDMGIRPIGTVLDRKDNDKGYEPTNCRWVTRKQSNENRRTTTIWIEYQGVKITVKDAAKQIGVSEHVIYQRLYHKWPIPAIFNPKINPGFDRNGLPARR
jgi:hypothetical protein